MNLEDFAKSKDIHHAVEEGYITEEPLLVETLSIYRDTLVPLLYIIFGVEMIHQRLEFSRARTSPA